MPHATFFCEVTCKGIGIHEEVEKIADSIKDELRALINDNNISIQKSIDKDINDNETTLQIEATCSIPLLPEEFRSYRTEMNEHAKTLEDTLKDYILPKSGLKVSEFEVDVEVDAEELEDYDDEGNGFDYRERI